MENIYKPYLMRIEAITQETSDIKTFKLMFQDDRVDGDFRFEPGQFGLFSVFGRGEAPFGIANSPTRGGYIECSVKRVGRVTHALHDLNLGDTVGFRGPYGRSFPIDKMRGKNLVFVVGKEHKQYRKADLPIFLARFAGFGDLTVPVDELDKYGFIGYIPNTDRMDAGEDYGQMFIVKDQLCDGTRSHVRTLPANPAVDPYFPIGQAALKLVTMGDQLGVTLQTMTPNFKEYQARIDEGGWKSSGADLVWNVHPGRNSLEVRTLNQFWVYGPISRVEVE